MSRPLYAKGKLTCTFPSGYSLAVGTNQCEVTGTITQYEECKTTGNQVELTMSKDAQTATQFNLKVPGVTNPTFGVNDSPKTYTPFKCTSVYDSVT
jgi:hypothetical protein